MIVSMSLSNGKTWADFGSQWMVQLGKSMKRFST